ncbi:heme-binding protein [Mycobacterium sp. M1]|uniref:Heme-binding protein n=1 Tax=Mycolicibacter acidiphilus TaxID=2835306 RepID=A0ABS5RG16_9MYCO|nr:heme-binding protein [Mycolicibacter acidiphilus]MBS9533114.1 heme-binding protein [Mycolicibacter acidiphilus]
MRGLTRTIAVGLASVALLTGPAAQAAPQQPCDETFGDSVDAYLKRHPDIRKNLEKHGQQEDPGSPNPVLSYLERHPDVRQALITLSQQCV